MASAMVTRAAARRRALRAVSDLRVADCDEPAVNDEIPRVFATPAAFAVRNILLLLSLDVKTK
jgi:hypothetical protein